MDFEIGKELRDQQYAATKDLTKNAEEEDADEEEQEVKASVAGVTPSQLVFVRKNKEQATLEDF